MATATKATVKGNKGKGKGKGKAGKASKATKAERTALATPEDREAAAKCDLNPVNYRVLRAIAKAGDKGLTYRGIQDVTGYYSILTAVCRAESGRGGAHGESLGAMKLIREAKEEKENGSSGPLTFYVTAPGKARLAKAK